MGEFGARLEKHADIITREISFALGKYVTYKFVYFNNLTYTVYHACMLAGVTCDSYFFDYFFVKSSF